MKKLNLSAVQSGVRKLGAVKATLEHLQEAYTEAIASVLKGLIAGETAPVAIHGVVNAGSHPNYSISAGVIFHSGELFEVDSFSGTAGGGQVPVLSLVTTYRGGDPVKYSDGTSHNTHAVRKLSWSFGASGSGLADFSDLKALKSKILSDLLQIPDNYVPKGRTLTAGAGLSGGGDLSGNRQFDVLVDDETIEINGHQLRLKGNVSKDHVQSTVFAGEKHLASADINTFGKGTINFAVGNASNAPISGSVSDHFLIFTVDGPNNGEIYQVAIQTTGAAAGAIYKRLSTLGTYAAWSKINDPAA